MEKASYLCRKKREDEYFVDDYEENDSFDYATKGYVQERGDEANCVFKGHGIETKGVLRCEVGDSGGGDY